MRFPGDESLELLAHFKRTSARLCVSVLDFCLSACGAPDIRKKTNQPLEPLNSVLKICLGLPLLFLSGMLCAQTPTSKSVAESIILTAEGTVEVFPANGAASAASTP